MIVAIDGNADLYILNPEDLTEETFVTNLGMQLTDLAYNPKDQELYGVNNSNQLVRIDKLCGSAESLGAIGGDIGIVVNTLACDGKATSIRCPMAMALPISRAWCLPLRWITSPAPKG